MITSALPTFCTAPACIRKTRKRKARCARCVISRPLAAFVKRLQDLWKRTPDSVKGFLAFVGIFGAAWLLPAAIGMSSDIDWSYVGGR